MIIGKNINIRPMESKDAELFYTWHSSQEIMGEYMSAELCYKEALVEGMKKDVTSGNSRQFILIIETKDGAPIGILSYLNSAFSNISVDFGILIGDRSQRSKGVGKEAVNLLVDYLFNTKNIARVQFMTRVDNEKMRALGEKTGFALDGILRKYRFDHGENWDICLYSITRDDWKNIR